MFCFSPQEIGIASDTLESAVSSDIIVHELFDSITREMIEEVGVTRDQISEPLLLGININNTTGGRCSLSFLSMRVLYTVTRFVKMYARLQLKCQLETLYSAVSIT